MKTRSQPTQAWGLCLQVSDSPLLCPVKGPRSDPSQCAVRLAPCPCVFRKLNVSSEGLTGFGYKFQGEKISQADPYTSLLLHVACGESGCFSSSIQGWHILGGRFLTVAPRSPGSVGTLSRAWPVQPVGTPRHAPSSLIPECERAAPDA